MCGSSDRLIEIKDLPIRPPAAQLETIAEAWQPDKGDRNFNSVALLLKS